MSRVLVQRAAELVDRPVSRRGFLRRFTLAATALSVAPVTYLLRPGTAYAATDSAAIIDSLESVIDTLDATLEDMVTVVDEQDYAIRIATAERDSCCADSTAPPSWKLPANWWSFGIAAVVGALIGIFAAR